MGAATVVPLSSKIIDWGVGWHWAFLGSKLAMKHIRGYRSQMLSSSMFAVLGPLGHVLLGRAPTS